MKRSPLTGKTLLSIGYPSTAVMKLAMAIMSDYKPELSEADVLTLLSNIKDNPTMFIEDPELSAIARYFMPKEDETISLKEEMIPYETYGANNIQAGAFSQMNNAMRLPVTFGGALMPDAHQGYGLPIGGVLATENAVIPYGVGVDIGCRMCLSIVDVPLESFDHSKQKLATAIENNTQFGAGGQWKKPNDAAVLDDPAFKTLPLLRALHEKAVKQLGTSGGGNHFVEWGIVTITDVDNEFNLPVGDYVALLSHSGSRALGGQIAQHYSKIAESVCPLPGDAKKLAYLSMDSEAGQEYWLAMTLAGEYASACHHDIHHRVLTSIGAKLLARVENHHNFAWEETYDGKNYIVHRKGATPAGKGVLGVIPGSMATPGYIVRGKGERLSFNSASHGAGRMMSRTQSEKANNWQDVNAFLKANHVTLLSAGLDEAPSAYKDIDLVMKEQIDLVDVIGKFQPRIVKMADDGTKED
ncbi:tRNA-splicing ligase RtcB [Chitinophaga skermanii]|uniref:3'-phosphate/5'-hydroxy nucleic acid ligase n=1 Tax=Chitinophaga skermanii TaxID=331697 RepID=A0A327R1M0_9BACT|nr:RtcB family protein [Chitinophaga skermanii]RAJ10531.1 tRNA-splicing ligase RtcB [Chitinophaga skermanii]